MKPYEFAKRLFRNGLEVSPLPWNLYKTNKALFYWVHLERYLALFQNPDTCLALGDRDLEQDFARWSTPALLMDYYLHTDLWIAEPEDSSGPVRALIDGVLPYAVSQGAPDCSERGPDVVSSGQVKSPNLISDSMTSSSTDNISSHINHWRDNSQRPEDLIFYLYLNEMWSLDHSYNKELSSLDELSESRLLSRVKANRSTQPLGRLAKVDPVLEKIELYKKILWNLRLYKHDQVIGDPLSRARPFPWLTFHKGYKTHYKEIFSRVVISQKGMTSNPWFQDECEWVLRWENNLCSLTSTQRDVVHQFLLTHRINRMDKREDDTIID